uniref:Uncharacterized protein n=1 Tax=Arundo donax TaxID=35708 RepID=A0A0A9AUU9_ARUDO
MVKIVGVYQNLEHFIIIFQKGKKREYQL